MSEVRIWIAPGGLVVVEVEGMAIWIDAAKAPMVADAIRAAAKAAMVGSPYDGTVEQPASTDRVDPP